MAETFVKRGSRARNTYMGEAAALRWLAEAEADGGIRVAKVISASDEELVIERIAQCPPTAAAAHAAGVALAKTHAAGAPYWGAGPTGFEDGSYRIMHSLTPCAPADKAPSSWGSFYADYRIRAYLSQLPAGFFTDEDMAQWDALLAKLDAGELDAPQPALVGDGPARCHGDLWSGNLLWDADPDNATGCALIDPMAHGGHAEEDLAMLSLFGFPQIPALASGYESVSPFAEGWRQRISLMQLAPLLLHCVLFGEGYRAHTLGTLKVALRYAG